MNRQIDMFHIYSCSKFTELTQACNEEIICHHNNLERNVMLQVTTRKYAIVENYLDRNTLLNKLLLYFMTNEEHQCE